MFSHNHFAEKDLKYAQINSDSTPLRESRPKVSKKCNFAMSAERVGIEGYGIFELVALYYGN